ncbi:MAG TPA: penicillin-binding transpeptidase domain-containing protein, partial [Anaerolineaceae bacterium]|nr:penicillin-binding transpeptidase domain-containing protein [Anaerolineaceae bacterium]
MKLRAAILLLIILLTACVPSNPTAATQTTAPSVTPPDPQIRTTSMPDARQAVEGFLEAWKQSDYTGMYARLLQRIRDGVTLEEFSAKYEDVATMMRLSDLDYEILSALTAPGASEVACRVTYHTALLGDMQRELVYKLVLEGGEWKLDDWSTASILPDLAGGKRLQMDVTTPARGNIYDASGNALAASSDAYALGVVPGKIAEGMEDALLAELSRLTGLNSDYIYSLYEFAGSDWYVPVGDAAAGDVDPRFDILTATGAQASRYSTRYYFDASAPHVVGYVQFIGEEEVEEYRKLGYGGFEKVGKAGLEKWAEEYLAGQRGAALYVVNDQGQLDATLGRTESAPAMSVYTTFDKDFQSQVQKALEGFRGAAVVIERDTGRVLAMASSPNFNPNLLDPNNINFQWQSGELSSESRPMINRASTGEYPLGSVFKIITMAAALETGAFTPESTYDCQHTFNEIIGRTYYDWTFEKEKPPSGLLTLPEGLMRSCNPWFYNIGLELFERGEIQALTDMAKGFGLGAATGIEQVGESTGNVPLPQSPEAAVELGIGQAELLVTPLQVANFVAAIGNGGTLHRPQVVEKVTDPDGNAVYEFEVEEIGTLPISDETLQVIRDAMRSVVANPRGTAHHVFLGIQAPIYGKTGTAQTASGKPHAWFAGYTDAQREDRPDIAIAVIAENAGEGSDFAAPIFRRIIEIYYNGRPGKLYPWESTYYVTQT